MSVLLYVVRGKAVFMIYHCVMRGLDGALKPGMCLEVKVEIEDSQKKKAIICGQEKRHIPDSAEHDAEYTPKDDNRQRWSVSRSMGVRTQLFVPMKGSTLT